MQNGARAIIDSVKKRAREMMETAKPLREILALLTSAVEQIAGDGSRASILLIDGQGLLRNGASPNLPADYLNKIDRLRPDPGVGTCAAAAATGRSIFTPDFQADQKWAELRHLPLSIGFRGAWSAPIKDAGGRVLGTFGTYFPDKRLPGPDEQAAVESLLELAAEAITTRAT